MTRLHQERSDKQSRLETLVALSQQLKNDRHLLLNRLRNQVRSDVDSTVLVLICFFVGPCHQPDMIEC